MKMVELGGSNWIGRRPQRTVSPDDFEDRIGTIEPMAYLPLGSGLSFGDCRSNDRGTLIDGSRHNRILSFDPGTGRISCEGGVTLHDILLRAIPHRFFLPVTPGTAFATVGGAVANDVHGRNHHARGAFGNHVQRLTLLRSTGERLVCSAEENADFFAATIGGMGLTGLILDVDLQLMKVPSPHIQRHVIRFGNLDEYFARVERVDEEHEYSIAWIDQLATGRRMGRGVFLAGDHADGSCELPDVPKRLPLSVPFALPFNPLDTMTMRAVNEYRFRRERPAETVSTVTWSSYFYPLDAIGSWNRLYGPGGPCQHQSVYPSENAPEITARLLEAARRAGHASFLTVLRRFGDIVSRGLLSFARPGFALTLDFANRGEATSKLLDELDRIVVDAGGAVNPCSDFRMSPQTFAASFPCCAKLEALRDPAMMSDFWRRIAHI
ncbi:FAD-binding oxidoreductase [Sinorhizobium terangae]|uniref:FAD-binding protein n=1 Tax=Sinorhizobium terangae TaxID=110322 RepID=A0A6N7LL01_SINTE|nr:FAD-binding oxidoreductase [Sinorhizobium terangae]MBB4187902.1 FAD/FMN-containing dehydrogenase [Sinorhizobium terangae]MQX18531.1 FAD-binding protein [Sinorhizobium terangae]WFU48844.1 FAD-binding oxidoreductase [Sinorhizobium terangae]